MKSLRTWMILFVVCYFWALKPKFLEGAEPDSYRWQEYHRKETNEPLPGTEPLSWRGDYARIMLTGIDRFLDTKMNEATKVREAAWQYTATNLTEYESFLTIKRKNLTEILGIRDKRLAGTPSWTSNEPITFPEHDTSSLSTISWSVFDDWNAEGIRAQSTVGPLREIQIILPHTGMAPHQYILSVASLLTRSQQDGNSVIVPALVGREEIPLWNRNGTYPARELLYRSAFEVGRHLVGYEVSMVLALIDSLKANPQTAQAKIQVGGYGEGGMIALYCGALDTRIDSVFVSGYFDQRESIARQPWDRSVFGLLNEFGDAEIAAMVFPRTLIIESVTGPNELFEPKKTMLKRQHAGPEGPVEERFPASVSAPWKLLPPQQKNVRAEVDRARQIVAPLSGTGDLTNWLILLDELNESLANSSAPKLVDSSNLTNLADSKLNREQWWSLVPSSTFPFIADEPYQSQQKRLITALDRHTQYILQGSAAVRRDFMSKLNMESLDRYKESCQEYREYFAQKVIGKFDDPLLPLRPQTRKVYEEEKWVGYDVVLDVFPEVYASGLLLLPKGIAEGEKRPVVVYQHGLEGWPDGAISRQTHNQIAGRLLEKGFIVFAPQDIYVLGDTFRSLQRKARPLGKTLYSFTVEQHRQIVEWLSLLPFVAKEQIGLYGISYGGKTAMRVPPLVEQYALSICSGDFGDWVYRVASTRENYSYAGVMEYEIEEFNLGGTFNHAEMAALIAPRPFMVERGYSDGCGRNEIIGYEHAKVRYLYDGQLKIGDRTEIDWFIGGHEIHATKTITFLEKYLKAE